MSRTLKDRPYWVRANDPASVRRESHQHIVTCREKIGEQPLYRRKLDKDGWHWHDELVGSYPVYRLWTEEVPCSIDKPEESPSVWRRATRRLTDEEFNNRVRNAKHCHYHLEFDGDYVSGKGFKRLSHSAERSKIRQQLQTALITHNQWWDDGEWDDVDIHNDSKYASRGWWDW